MICRTSPFRCSLVVEAAVASIQPRPDYPDAANDVPPDPKLPPAWLFATAQVRRDLSRLAEEAAEPRDGFMEAGQAERVPQTGLHAAHHWLAEIALEQVEDADGRQAGTTQE